VNNEYVGGSSDFLFTIYIAIGISRDIFLGRLQTTQEKQQKRHKVPFLQQFGKLLNNEH